MLQDSFLVIQCSEDFSGNLKRSSPEASPIFVDGPDEGMSVLVKMTETIRTIVIGALCPNPIQTAQKFHSYDKDLSFIILSEPNHFDGLKRSVSFSPFLGNSVFCLSSAEVEKIAPMVLRLNLKAKKKQNLKGIVSKANAQLQYMPSFQSMDLSSSQYIERLFEVAPIGIVTVSHLGHILSINRFFGQMIDAPETKLLGQFIQNYFPKLELKDGGQTDIEREGYVYDANVTSVRGYNREAGYLILFVDVTDRIKNEEALRRAVSARDEFISIASHELRTPLTSLRMQLQFAQKKRSVMGEEKLEKMFDVSIKQVDRLTTLIVDLLDVTKIQTGQLSYKFETANLRAVLDGVLERFESPVKIAVSGAAELIAKVDVFRMEQVFVNLLSNAVKYGEGNGIEIKLEASKKECILRFKDHGMGIAEDKIGFIFDKFARAISSSNISGLGLGLYITKSIVDAHGGEISVESVFGEWTVFTLRLPRV